MAMHIVKVGEVFGKWTVISEADSAHGERRVWARCDCGHERMVDVRSLLRGRSSRCPTCSNTVHHRSNSPTWNSWQAMHDRCKYAKKISNQKDYIARGITVCARWSGWGDGFKNFLADMGERPPGMTLDRIDNDGN